MCQILYVFLIGLLQEDNNIIHMCWQNTNSTIWQIILLILIQKGCRYLPLMDRLSQNQIICAKVADIWDIDMLHYFK